MVARRGWCAQFSPEMKTNYVRIYNSTPFNVDLRNLPTKREIETKKQKRENPSLPRIKNIYSHVLRVKISTKRFANLILSRLYTVGRAVSNFLSLFVSEWYYASWKKSRTIFRRKRSRLLFTSANFTETYLFSLGRPLNFRGTLSLSLSLSIACNSKYTIKRSYAETCQGCFLKGSHTGGNKVLRCI